jgi:hypothetical protein
MPALVIYTSLSLLDIRAPVNRAGSSLSRKMHVKLTCIDIKYIMGFVEGLAYFYRHNDV